MTAAYAGQQGPTQAGAEADAEIERPQTEQQAADVRAVQHLPDVGDTGPRSHERAGRPRSAYDYRFFAGFTSAAMG
jgi:hypothetical protein